MKIFRRNTLGFVVGVLFILKVVFTLATYILGILTGELFYPFVCLYPMIVFALSMFSDTTSFLPGLFVILSVLHVISVLVSAVLLIINRKGIGFASINFFVFSLFEIIAFFLLPGFGGVNWIIGIIYNVFLAVASLMVRKLAKTNFNEISPRQINEVVK